MKTICVVCCDVCMCAGFNYSQEYIKKKLGYEKCIWCALIFMYVLLIKGVMLDKILSRDF